MEGFKKSSREELKKYEGYLQNDIDAFNKQLNLTRENLFNYMDRQIEYLLKAKKEYKKEFDYLDEENKKTCKNNRQEFDKLCVLINQNDHNARIVSDLLEKFKQTFPMRPTMLKSIPEYYFQDIHINDFIKNQHENEDNSLTLPTANGNSSFTVLNGQSLTENKEEDHMYPKEQSEFVRSSNRFPSIKEHSFIPVKTAASEDIQVPSIPTSSIGFSHHKQFASQNNEIDVEPQSRLVSTCSTIVGPDTMVDLLFKIPYEHNRTPRLIAFNEDENCLLIYSLFSHQLEYLSFHSHLKSFITLSFNQFILNLGYSTEYHLFYLSTRQKNRFILFRLNQQQIEIDQEIELIHRNDHFISVHMYENFVFFLYLSSSIVMFGQYNLENSSFIPPLSFDKKLYDEREKSTFNIIDFAINSSYISFLSQLKIKNNKFIIVIYDSYNMNKLYSFDLIDSIKPLSIISTTKKSKSAMPNDETELLLFVNDPQSHLIHCCTHQQYLIPIQVNAFGICALNDGNLSLVASRDVRGLNVQDYLKRNNGLFD